MKTIRELERPPHWMDIEAVVYDTEPQRTVILECCDAEADMQLIRRNPKPFLRRYGVDTSDRQVIAKRFYLDWDDDLPSWFVEETITVGDLRQEATR